MQDFYLQLLETFAKQNAIEPGFDDLGDILKNTLLAELSQQIKQDVSELAESEPEAAEAILKSITQGMYKAHLDVLLAWIPFMIAKVREACTNNQSASYKEWPEFWQRIAKGKSIKEAFSSLKGLPINHKLRVLYFGAGTYLALSYTLMVCAEELVTNQATKLTDNTALKILITAIAGSTACIFGETALMQNHTLKSLVQTLLSGKFAAIPWPRALLATVLREIPFVTATQHYDTILNLYKWLLDEPSKTETSNTARVLSYITSIGLLLSTQVGGRIAAFQQKSKLPISFLKTYREIAGAKPWSNPFKTIKRFAPGGGARMASLGITCLVYNIFADRLLDSSKQATHALTQSMQSGHENSDVKERKCMEFNPF